MSKQWIRVHGPDLHGDNYNRYERNSAIMRDNRFKSACGWANIPVTRRQASKWANHKGLAYKHR